MFLFCRAGHKHVNAVVTARPSY